MSTFLITLGVFMGFLFSFTSLLRIMAHNGVPPYHTLFAALGWAMLALGLCLR